MTNPQVVEWTTSAFGAIICAPTSTANLATGIAASLSSRSMRCACVTVSRMHKMIQIRNVPEATHRTLKARAAQRGLSLSDYLLAQVQQLADLPTIEELNARIRTRKPVRGSSAKAIRRWRDAT